ncbi:MAG: c-type cytochrome [Myxococcales bacterium]|nr:MAG: c-type cytochrome [Myxococcales bacterium]
MQTALSQVGGGKIRSSGGLSAGLAVDVAVRRDGQAVLAVPGDGIVSSLLSVPVKGDLPGGTGEGGSTGQAGASGGDPFPDDGILDGSQHGIPGFIGTEAWPCSEGSVRSFAFNREATSDAMPVSENVATMVSAVAVAFDRDDELVAQMRSPHGVWWAGRFHAFGGDAETTDTGHQIFHMAPAGGLACASCHPEGGEDGRVWNFQSFGPRRTQSLQGGLRGSEPFHWSGDMSDITTLMTEVFSGRMSGPPASAEQADAVMSWLDQVPVVPPPSVDGGALARGKAVFESEAVGCQDCHQGSRQGLAGTFDVGTGEPLQVPSLRGLAYRAPFLHDGRAATLLDRFGPAGGGDRHGHTSQLSPAQIDDLVAYLTSL